MKTAKELAINLIKPYVLRGDSIRHIKTPMGFSGGGDSVQLSGYLNGKHYSTDYIIVNRLNNEEVEYKFKFMDIYNEILNPQTKLF